MKKIVHTIKCVSSAFRGIPNEFIILRSAFNTNIVFYSVDRFSRNYTIGLQFLEYLVDCRNKITFIRENLEINDNIG